MSAVTIDQNWLDKNKNPKVNDSVFKRSLDYVDKSIGGYRALQAIQKTVKLGNEIAKEVGVGTSATLKDLERNLSVGLGALNIPRLPSVTSSAIKSLSSLTENTGVPADRKAMRALRNTAEAASAYSYAISFIKSNPVVRTFASTAELASNMADLQISASDYSKASKLEAIAVGDAKDAFGHAKAYFSLRLVKVITSIASNILGLWLLATGAPLVPTIAYIIISLAATIFAISRDLYNKHPVIDYFDRGISYQPV